MATLELTPTAHDEAVEVARKLQAAYTKKIEIKLLIAIDALEAIADPGNAISDHHRAAYQALVKIRRTT